MTPAAELPAHRESEADGGMPPGQALHGREAGGLVVAVDELDDGLWRAVRRVPRGLDAHHAHVADGFRARADVGLEQRVEHVARNDG